MILERTYILSLVGRSCKRGHRKSPKAKARENAKGLSQPGGHPIMNVKSILPQILRTEKPRGKNQEKPSGLICFFIGDVMKR